MPINNPHGNERDGPRFTVQQRRERRDQAWEMHVGGMPQLKIATELGVDQATVCHWLKRKRLELRADG